MHISLSYVLPCLLIGILAVPGVTAVSHSLGEDASGSEITIALGDTIGITIAENPTTGYMWNFTIPGGLTLLDDTFIPPARPIPGAGGHRSLVIRGDREGTYMVSGVYYRPWLVPTPEDEVFTLTVHVTGSAALSPSPARLPRFMPAKPLSDNRASQPGSSLTAAPVYHSFHPPGKLHVRENPVPENFSGMFANYSGIAPWFRGPAPIRIPTPSLLFVP